MKERKNRKRGIAAAGEFGFSVPNNQKVIELTFLNVVEERYERNERTAGGFCLSITSNQTVIKLLDSLIKPDRAYKNCTYTLEGYLDIDDDSVEGVVEKEEVENYNCRKFKKKKYPKKQKVFVWKHTAMKWHLQKDGFLTKN